MGHGCLYDDTIPPITVPEGVIWIENELCGFPTHKAYISPYLSNEAVQVFLQNTPIPITPKEKTTYRSTLASLTKVEISVKFPGETITDGDNDLLLTFSKDKRYTHSGIIPLYTELSRGYNVEALSPKPAKTKAFPILTNEDTNDMYSYSIYPTKEQSKQYYTDYLMGRNSKGFKFSELFNDITEKTNKYNLTYPTNIPNNHMIIIQGSCRKFCSKSPTTSTARIRRNSVNRLNLHLGQGELNDLRIKNSTGKTNLIKYVQKDLLEQTNTLLTKLKSLMTPTDFYSYITTEDNTKKSAIDYAIKDSNAYNIILRLLMEAFPFYEGELFRNENEIFLNDLLQKIRFKGIPGLQFPIILRHIMNSLYTNGSYVPSIIEKMNRNNSLRACIVFCFHWYKDNKVADKTNPISFTLSSNVSSLMIYIVSSPKELTQLITLNQDLLSIDLNIIGVICTTCFSMFKYNVDVIMLYLTILDIFKELSKSPDYKAEVKKTFMKMIVYQKNFLLEQDPTTKELMDRLYFKRTETELLDVLKEPTIITLTTPTSTTLTTPTVEGGKRHRTFRQRKGKQYTSRNRVSKKYRH